MFALSLSFLASIAATVRALPFSERSTTGPVISSNFQDPSVLQVGSSWYAFAGPNGNPSVNVLVATSPDGASWSVDNGYDALPYAGPWAASVPHLWSPDVVQLESGAFVLYYSADTAASPGQHCIGAATSNQPQGPFTPQNAPLFCDLSAGGAIDANGFRDPVTGNQYVVYKVDGNSIGHGGDCSNSVAPIVPTPLLLQQVSRDDGFSPIGSPFTLLTNDASDGPGIEAPALLYDSGQQHYVLLYSSGCYTNPAYAIKYATSASLAGPFTKQPGDFLQTGSTAADVYLPGGIDVTPDGKTAVFHGDLNKGWFQNDGSKRVRGMYSMEITLSGGAVLAGQLN